MNMAHCLIAGIGIINNYSKGMHIKYFREFSRFKLHLVVNTTWLLLTSFDRSINAFKF